MAFGLKYGTEENETYDVYQDKRRRLSDITKEFMPGLERQFGSVNCMDLLDLDRRTEEGRSRYDELRARGVFRCDEYVEWSAEKAQELLSSGC